MVFLIARKKSLFSLFLYHVEAFTSKSVGILHALPVLFPTEL